MFFRNPILNLSTFEKRDRVTIFMDILKSTRDSRKGKKKTQIIQSANLSHYQANKYLHLLLVNGLLFVDGEDRYRVTDRGAHFVKTLEALHLTLK